MTALDMEVVEQTDSVYRNDSLYDRAVFIVDVPVKGPKLLMDSVIAFVNIQLYVLVKVVCISTIISHHIIRKRYSLMMRRICLGIIWINIGL